MGWDDLAKDTPHGPHQGEAKNQNNLIIVGTILPGIKKFSSWQPLWLFLWISQVSGLARKQNASQHNNGVVCCSQSIKHKNPEEREKNVLSSLPDQPVFSQRKVHACVCKKDVLTLQLICFRELALKGGEAELLLRDWHSPFFTSETLLIPLSPATSRAGASTAGPSPAHSLFLCGPQAKNTSYIFKRLKEMF